MSERGMKKWAPYKSLPEYNPKVIEMKKSRHKIEKPKLSSDEAEQINEILKNYHNQELELKYFKNSEIYKYIIYIKKIDIINRVIISTDGDKYSLINIVGLKNI